VLAHRRRLDWYYVVQEGRKPVAERDLAQRVWTCEICGQKVIKRPDSALPILPPGYFEDCKLRDRMIGDECLARRDLEAARRLMER
jgi:hypothetical protein